jgi:hypothetical protein
MKKKPIVFSTNKTVKHSQNDLGQRLLLKAISEGVTNIDELRKIAGMKTATDVYRTLDKMALRREYHAALATNGVDFEYLVKGIKDVCDNGMSDKVRLSGYQTLLKSLGLDKYEKVEDSGKSWEESIIQLTRDNVEEGNLLAEPSEGEDDDVGDLNRMYEVEVPEMPEDEKKRRERDKELSDSFYG